MKPKNTGLSAILISATITILTVILCVFVSPFAHAETIIYEVHDMAELKQAVQDINDAGVDATVSIQNDFEVDGGDYTFDADSDGVTGFTVTVLGNGHTLTKTSDGGTFLYADKGTTMNLGDVNDPSNTLTVDGGSSIGMAFVYVRGTVNMYEGTTLTNFTKSYDASMGASIKVDSTGTLNIYGGSILNAQSYNGASANYGSAIAIDGGILNIYSVYIDNCEVGAAGGAIFAQSNAVLNINNAYISNSSADGAGGAIYTSSSSLTVINSEIAGCSGTYGGAICAVNSSVIIQGTTFTSNSCTIYGGAVYIQGGSVELDWNTNTTTTFSDNYSSCYAGAFCANGSATTVYLGDVNVYDNGALYAAGGVLFFSIPEVYIQDKMIIENNYVTDSDIDSDLYLNGTLLVFTETMDSTSHIGIADELDYLNGELEYDLGFAYDGYIVTRADESVFFSDYYPNVDVMLRESDNEWGNEGYVILYVPIIVNFDGNGGTADFSTAIADAYSFEISVYPSATLTDYDFVEWCFDAAGEYPIEENQTYSQNTTLYASYTLTSHPVDFTTNKEDVVIDGETVVHGETVQTYPDAPSIVGYTFDGWFIDDTYSEEWDIDGSILQPTTVYGLYTPIEYTVTFMDDETLVAEETYTVDAPYVTSPAVPEKDGFTALWQIFEINPEDPQNIVVYAVWVINEYPVEYVTNNECVVYAGELVEYMSTAAEVVGQDVFGYSFSGWYLDETYTEFYDFDTPVIEAITLYGVYTLTEYTVTFVSDGIAVDAQTYTIEEENITSPDLEEVYGYTVYWPEYSVDITEPKDMFVYAVWEPCLFTVSFDYDCDDFENYDEFVAMDTLAAEPEEPDRSGYTFDGWYDEDGILFDFETTTIVADITLTAQWTVIPTTTTTTTTTTSTTSSDEVEYVVYDVPPTGISFLVSIAPLLLIAAILGIAFFLYDRFCVYRTKHSFGNLDYPD